jgi:phospholipase C
MVMGLASVDHFVVLMLENRSLDHMLGFLYRDSGNVSGRGDPFDGLTGTENCPGADGTPVQVFPITPTTANAYFLPGADPGEGFLATNAQLFGTASPPTGAIACKDLSPTTRRPCTPARNKAGMWSQEPPPP